MAIAPLSPGTALLPDTTVDGGFRFRVETVLGAGGFGLTYKATDLQLAAHVVIKELAISDICARGTVDARIEPLPRGETEFRYWKDRFFDEARRANQIRHPHVVRIIAVWRERGTVYYAMDEVRDARSLPCSTHAGWRQPDWAIARGRSLALLEALAAVHATSLIHGDIKPSNVLLDHDDQLVLIDFGTARRINELTSTATSTMYTPGYAPPELMINSRVREAGPCSDLYSWAMLTIGMMVYHPTPDQQPLNALTRLQLQQYGGQDPYEGLAQDLLDAGISEVWTTVLLSCIALTPGDRLQSVSSVLGVLGSEGLAPGTLPASIREAQLNSSATVPLPQLDSPRTVQSQASQKSTPRPPQSGESAFAQTVDNKTPNTEQPSLSAFLRPRPPQPDPAPAATPAVAPATPAVSPATPAPPVATQLPRELGAINLNKSATTELPRGAATLPALPQMAPTPKPVVPTAVAPAPSPAPVATPQAAPAQPDPSPPATQQPATPQPATPQPARPNPDPAPWNAAPSAQPPDSTTESAPSGTRRVVFAAVLMAALIATAGVFGWPWLSTLLPAGLLGAEGSAGPDSAVDPQTNANVSAGTNDGSSSPNPALSAVVPTGFVRVEPGTFAMGSPPQEAGRKTNEPLHDVTLTRPLAVQVNEVTHQQWRDLMGTSPWFFTRCGLDCPVERVNWYDAISWANALSISEGLTPCYTLSACIGQPGSGLTTPLDSTSPAPGEFRCAEVTFVGLNCNGYRLPTEAEWEYIARAGTYGPWWGADPGTPINTACDASAPIRTAAWYECNARTEYFSPIRVGSGDSSTRVGPHPVGTIGANPWNINDLLGNVAEWTHDGSDRPDTGASTDPLGQGGSRTVRGGHFRSPALELRAAARNLAAPDIRSPDIGFRVVRTLPQQ
jgi:formylglycine-generating enzyme required for sulfatase activity/serine/threonine protein kinase